MLWRTLCTHAFLLPLRESSVRSSCGSILKKERGSCFFRYPILVKTTFFLKRGCRCPDSRAMELEPRAFTRLWSGIEAVVPSLSRTANLSCGCACDFKPIQYLFGTIQDEGISFYWNLFYAIVRLSGCRCSRVGSTSFFRKDMRTSWKKRTLQSTTKREARMKS